LLKIDGIRIFEGPKYSRLSLEHRYQIPHIIKLLKANDISCTIADVVEQVYRADRLVPAGTVGGDDEFFDRAYSRLI